MIKQDYIMLILNCKKYIKKAKFQKMTWLKKIPLNIQYYHVIGNKELDEIYKFDNENNILWVKVQDDYISLPKKIITAYNAIYNTYDFKYIFKTDDDQILVNDKFFNILFSLLEKNNEKYNYGGYIVDVKQNYLSQYYKIHPELPKYLPILKTKYCSGRFYFLSKSSVKDLLNKSEYIIKEYLEDYAIGLYLDLELKNNMLNLLTNKYFTDIELSDFPVLFQKGLI